jgi:hypothetical protein
MTVNHKLPAKYFIITVFPSAAVLPIISKRCDPLPIEPETRKVFAQPVGIVGAGTLGA